MKKDFSSEKYEAKIKSDIATGLKKEKITTALVVRNEFFFWETRIKCWCRSNEEYIEQWKKFLSECGCGDVSASYIERLLSKVASEKNFKRSDCKFRNVSYE